MPRTGAQCGLGPDGLAVIDLGRIPAEKNLRASMGLRYPGDVLAASAICIGLAAATISATSLLHSFPD